MNPVVFLTTKENAEIVVLLSQRLIQWQKKWCVELSDIKINRGEDLSTPEGFHFCNLNNDLPKGQSIGVKFISDTKKLLFGENSTQVPDDRIWFDIMDSAINKLIVTMNQLTDLPKDSSISSGCIGCDGDKYFRYICSFANQSCIELLIPESLVLSFITRYKKLNNATLNNRKAVLGNEKVKLDVSLSLGDVSLKSLNNLSIGDILITKKELSAELNILSNERVLAQAVIGKKGNCKAIEINEIYNES